ncbi:MAG: type II toxin-antitoxin system RelE/ParE family toxin [Eubacteriales bacterium]|nr:type II toxin-antitoxin system RelE/ParE family toxin [Eubacteriales bacterium]
MTRTFIQTSEFSKNWDRLGFGDEALRQLELEIMRQPMVGKVIRGTGRLRKMRFAFEHKGKSGSVRVCYVDFVVQRIVYLITVYSKNEKENLSIAERNNIKKAIEQLENNLLEET